jgi:hypothetical protein
MRYSLFPKLLPAQEHSKARFLPAPERSKARLLLVQEHSKARLLLVQEHSTPTFKKRKSYAKNSIKTGLKGQFTQHWNACR